MFDVSKNEGADKSFNNVLRDVGDTVVKDLNQMFKQDPSKVLDVLNQMQGGGQPLPEGFPSAGDLFGPTTGDATPQIAPVGESGQQILQADLQSVDQGLQAIGQDLRQIGQDLSGLFGQNPLDGNGFGNPDQGVNWGDLVANATGSPFNPNQSGPIEVGPPPALRAGQPVEVGPPTGHRDPIDGIINGVLATGEGLVNRLSHPANGSSIGNAIGGIVGDITNPIGAITGGDHGNDAASTAEQVAGDILNPIGALINWL